MDMDMVDIVVAEAMEAMDMEAMDMVDIVDADALEEAMVDAVVPTPEDTQEAVATVATATEDTEEAVDTTGDKHPEVDNTSVRRVTRNLFSKTTGQKRLKNIRFLCNCL